MSRFTFSPLSIRYLSPYTEHIRGGTGSYVLDAAIERVERLTDGYRVHASGTTWEGRLALESDEVIAATGFRTPVRDLPDIGVTLVNDGRLPALTPYWESVSVPGIYFAGNVTQASAGLRKHGATSSSGSVNGYRYNGRLLARHIAKEHFGLHREARLLAADEVVPYLLAELAHAPELWVQKGYLARVVDAELRDEGLVPLTDFVDRDGGDACAVAIEYDAAGAVVPVVYVRKGGRLLEHPLPPHPLHDFSGDEYRRELASRLAPLLS